MFVAWVNMKSIENDLKQIYMAMMLGHFYFFTNLHDFFNEFVVYQKTILKKKTLLIYEIMEVNNLSFGGKLCDQTFPGLLLWDW